MGEWIREIQAIYGKKNKKGIIVGPLRHQQGKLCKQWWLLVPPIKSGKDTQDDPLLKSLVINYCNNPLKICTTHGLHQPPPLGGGSFLLTTAVQIPPPPTSAFHAQWTISLYY
ncbi:low density lipoprotein-related protein 2-like protein [Corchorus capsularis]|uniref:Low density lipoprotein-related protein 2-like protein n=1 Tax=Corchorus capsularis TaxID=210143 RepID=A0A1R3FX23_COCAP|nr:low density lipoprotein-related protein 2-like protein [Corchorus capsularis]